MANRFIGLPNGVAWRIEYNWTEESGFTFTDVYRGPKAVLQEIFDSSNACGFSDASFTEYSEGDAIWELKLTYVGHPNQIGQAVRPQVEELTTHWLIQSRIANAPLWRHPQYEPLLHCKVTLGRAIWRYEPDPDDEEGRYRWRPAGTDAPNAPTYVSSEQFPYSGVLQTAINSWRQARQTQLTTFFSEVVLNRPTAAANEIRRSIKAVPNVVDLTQEFDVNRHLSASEQITFEQEGLLPDPTVADVEYRYRLLPVSAHDAKGELLTNPITNKPFTQDELIALAQRFANEMLARRETYEWDRGTIVNDRVIGSRGGLGIQFGGIRQVWSSAQVAYVIREQLRIRRAAQTVSPVRCRDLDGVLEDMATNLPRAFPDTRWVRRIPDMRQSGRGKIEVRDEWEEKKQWEIDPEIYPNYTGRSA